MTLDFVLRWLTVLFLIIFNIFSATVIEDYINMAQIIPAINLSLKTQFLITFLLSALYDVTKKGYP